MANRRNNQFPQTPHNKATILDCNFTVNAADTGGLGITGLNASGRIQSVYMHTSATPATGNPNPQAGDIIINLQDNYYTFLGMDLGIGAPLTGSDISISGSSVLTIGKAYVITSVGTSTTANWVTAGMASNLTPAVGVGLIAAITGTGTGTGKVQAAVTTGSGFDHCEVIGNPNVMQSSTASGMQIILSCFKNTALTNPADGTKLFFQLYFNDTAFGV